MFYCEPCRTRFDWPRSSTRWRSVCEMCDTFSEDCNDIPSRALTDPSFKEEQPSDIHTQVQK